jgi:hypothetical protein
MHGLDRLYRCVLVNRFSMASLAASTPPATIPTPIVTTKTSAFVTGVSSRRPILTHFSKLNPAICQLFMKITTGGVRLAQNGLTSYIILM